MLILMAVDLVAMPSLRDSHAIRLWQTTDFIRGYQMSLLRS
jgi:hypothetical protein